ncbi:MAG TPA: outer membrane beta-barrel protein [Candidatus Mailhella merdavium]|nr:outer membrane beta-barrel protein [Candidatus Mailhella merdavium]
MNKFSILAGLRRCAVTLALVFTASALFTAPANAGAEGLYFAGKLGLNFQSLDNANRGLSGEKDQTIGIGAAMGYDFYPLAAMPVRVELELMYQTEAKYTNAGTTLKDSISTVFVNGFYDFHTGTIFTPYVGLGIGTAWVDSEGSVNGYGTGTNTESNFAWNIGAGLGIELDYNLSFDINYRYAGFGTARTGSSALGVADGSLRTHQVLAGLRYTF